MKTTTLTCDLPGCEVAVPEIPRGGIDVFDWDSFHAIPLVDRGGVSALEAKQWFCSWGHLVEYGAGVMKAGGA